MYGQLLTAIFFSTVQASASTILFKAPQAVQTEYGAMLRADGEYVSPTESYAASHPLLSHRETLLALLSEAQTAFLEKSVPEAQAKFKAVIAMATEDDWAQSDREVFLHAYLRLAQMEPPGKSADAFIAASTALGSDLSVDETLFPPPLLQKRAALIKGATGISRGGFGTGWTRILINGQACGATSCGRWLRTAGPVRVTFLSDQWQPQTVVVDIAKVAELRPKAVAWASGDCGSPRLSDAAGSLARKRVFWGLECDKADMQTRKLRLSPAAAPLAENSIPAIPLTSESKPFYKSGWFWGGVGAVVAFIIIKNSQGKNEKETTTTYGLH